MTEESAASELLKRWGASDDASPEASEADESDSEPADEAMQDEDDAAESDAGETADGVEIDVAGEKFRLPPALAEDARRIEAKVKEIEAGATRKFQEAAELRKVAETQTAHAQQLSQLSQAEVNLRADRRMVERRLEQIMSIDSATMADNDPVALTRLNAEFNQLQLAQSRIDEALGEIGGRKNQMREQTDAQKFQYLRKYATDHIKGWSQEYEKTLFEFSVKELGADPEALHSVMSEPVLKALDLAYQGWKVRKAEPKSKQVTGTKTLKPGASGQSRTNAQQIAEKANRRLGQTGKVDDAAAALLARMSAKRR